MQGARNCRRIVALAAICAGFFGSTAPYSAIAHVGPSVRENNRYLKLTLLGNRVRLLYTFYVGEVPGAQARRRMDANGDGQLQPSEQQAYGDQIAATVAANLALTVDGAATPLQWQSVDTGIGTPTVNAGAFSIDMVAWLCVSAQASHRIALYDHWVPPTPGETELRIEESPGVAVSKATLGEDGQVSQLRARWVGATPLDKLGLHLAFEVDGAEADMTAVHGCGESNTASAGSGTSSQARTWLVVGGAFVLLALAGATLALKKR